MIETDPGFQRMRPLAPESSTQPGVLRCRMHIDADCALHKHVAGGEIAEQCLRMAWRITLR
jgi:hypothetical protein